MCKHWDLPKNTCLFLPKNGTITFIGTTHIPTLYLVLLEAHTIIARILYMTAITEIIKNILRN